MPLMITKFCSLIEIKDRSEANTKFNRTLNVQVRMYIFMNILLNRVMPILVFLAAKYKSANMK